VTLDEMLALLPDNTVGAISAADLRLIVTDLFARATAVADRVTYGWSASDSSPPTGKLFLSGGWTTAGGTASMSETTDDGVLFGFGVLDRGDTVRMVMTGPLGQSMHLTLSGPSVDQGNYRDCPYTVQTVVGVPPGDADLLSVDVVVVLTP
jgi:hypothetical protein